MKPYLSALATCLVLSSAMLVPDVYAQFGGGVGGGMGGGGGRHGSGERPRGCDSADGKPDAAKGPAAGQQGLVSREQLEYHLGTLKIDLKLTPEQTTAWQAFADHVLALQADMERQRGRTTSAQTANTAATGGIKPIANAVDAARNRLTALEDIESTGRTLYQSLQPDQKSLADLRMASFITPLLKG